MPHDGALVRSTPTPGSPTGYVRAVNTHSAYTDAQFESVAQLVVAASRALGLPINRSTVVVHADINSGADLLHAVYDRITVAGRRIVSMRLTPSAYAYGFALALPEKVVLARPTVSEFTT